MSACNAVLTLNGRGNNIGSSPSKMTNRTVSFVDDKPPPSKRIEVRKASLNTVPDTAKRIEDLCSELGKATATRSNLCIGILVDASNERWHRIWPPPPSLLQSPYVPESVPLDELLHPGCLEKWDRLNLGVKLASAVMQLHGTPWLGESWGGNDILFMQKVITRRMKTGNLPCQYVQTYEPVIDQPFVRRMFGSSEALVPLEQITPPPQENVLPEYNKSLFSLGIVLTELWFERRIEELRTQPSQALASNTQDSTSYIPTMDHADYATAQQCIGKLNTYAGDKYGLAVSRCIDGLNRPGEPPRASQNTLDNEVFKNDVYINIVCLLEKNLEVHLPRV